MLTNECSTMRISFMKSTLEEFWYQACFEHFQLAISPLIERIIESYAVDVKNSPDVVTHLSMQRIEIVQCFG